MEVKPLCSEVNSCENCTKCEKECTTCKFYSADYSTGTSECEQFDNMSEEEIDYYYSDANKGCPHWRPAFDPKEEEYMMSLMAEQQEETL